MTYLQKLAVKDPLLIEELWRITTAADAWWTAERPDERPKVGWVTGPALAGFPSERNLLAAVDRSSQGFDVPLHRCMQREPFQ